MSRCWWEADGTAMNRSLRTVSPSEPDQYEQAVTAVINAGAGELPSEHDGRSAVKHHLCFLWRLSRRVLE
jgi:hypothetical protein